MIAAAAGKTATIKVSDRIGAQVSFWADPAPVRGFVGGLGSGKTFAGAVAILQLPPSRGMVVAPTYGMMRDSAQATFFEVCPPQLVHTHNIQRQITTLHNGTAILWRSADRPKSLRGPSLSWVWADEYAYCSESTHQVLVGRLRRPPARLFFTTTPNGRNWLYDWCVTRDLGYSLHNAHTDENPFNAPGYAATLAQQYAHTPEYAEQELAGRWVDLSGCKRIPASLLHKVCAPGTRCSYPTQAPITSTPPTPGAKAHAHSLSALRVRVYVPPTPGARYVLGVDCAEGVGGDDSTMVISEQTTGAVVCVAAGQFEPQQAHPAYVAQLSRWYNKAPALIERNNHGHAVLAGCRRLGVRCLSGHDGRPGWSTQPATKARMWSETHAVIEACARDGIILIPDAQLQQQVGSIDMHTLSAPGKGRVQRVDDLAVAFALSQCARRLAQPSQARTRSKMRSLIGAVR